MIREAGHYGTSRFRVRLIARPDAPVGRVLSEGEHRCIALAGFLTELATATDRSALVFDDPASSLDHLYRDALAGRLVEEAASRQVIVFTHDLWFIFRLARLASEKGMQPFYQHVCRNDQQVGLCDSDPPIDSRPVDEAIRHLRRRLNDFRALYDSGKMGPWQEHAQGLVGRIRTTWERAVEEVIAPVFRRFDHDVDTKNLRKLTVLREGDCQRVDESRARCSQLQHSRPAVAGSPSLTPDAIETEINGLEAWFNDVRGRQEKLQV